MSTSASISRISLLASTFTTADTPGMVEGMALSSFLRLSARALSWSSWRVLRDSLQSPPPFLKGKKRTKHGKEGKGPVSLNFRLRSGAAGHSGKQKLTPSAGGHRDSGWTPRQAKQLQNQETQSYIGSPVLINPPGCGHPQR